MKRAARQRCFLLLAVLALLALAGWQLQHDARAANGSLLSIDPAGIRRVALTLPDAPTMQYDKRDGHWWRVDGPAVRSDDGRLAELTAIAGASVLTWRPATDFQPQRIGLNPPAATLVLDGQSLEFGETSVTGPQRYVRAGDRVALISVRYMPRPPTGKVTPMQAAPASSAP